jgi:hypothetical protein
MLFGGTVVVYCESHMEHTNTLSVGRMQCTLKEVVSILTTRLERVNRLHGVISQKMVLFNYVIVLI